MACRYKYLVGDFETTVYDGQTHTEVWASAIVPLNSCEVKIFNSIDETYYYLRSLKGNLIVYYHNLKFDGTFWLAYLLQELHYTQALIKPDSKTFINAHWKDDDDLEEHELKYAISLMGQWYSIKIKIDGRIIEFRDSLKLLPFSVAEIGKAFKTEHQKLNMEYVGRRYAGCLITDDEKRYIANDVLVVKEALEIMFKQGHKKLTIGSCCLAEFKRHYYDEWEKFFPDVYAQEIDSKFSAKTVGDYIHKSYKGGWCYLVEGKENKVYNNGVTYDVNSLYPSMMSSESGNRYPVGNPTFWSGNYIPDEARINNRYYFVRLRTRFYIKPNRLPFIQLKNNPLYCPNECLKTSDVYSKKTGTYYSALKDDDGELIPTAVELTLTCVDWLLFQEHYQLVDCEILDGCYFESEIGLFDLYINKYKKIKLESKGAMRTLAKLFLNNLYGKMASSPDSSFKVVYEKADRSLSFMPVLEKNKQAGYIPIGSAITSYARNFTIREAQKHYHGENERGFIYADTDSIHCDLTPCEMGDIPVHERDFCKWKLESIWSEAIFVRQKTYIEHVTENEDGETNEYSIKCAGMPQACKDKLEIGLCSGEMELIDFKKGLKVDGKLTPKRIDGGTILVETTYEIK